MLRSTLLSLIFAMAVAALVIALQKGSFGELWAKFTGRSLDADFYYDNCSGGSFKVVGNSFAVCSNGVLYLFNEDGEETLTRLISFSDAKLCAAGDFAALYDVGGSSAIFFSEDSVICDVETELPLTSASVNGSGYLAVCAQESGYMGAVTVYNRNGTAIYKWYSGTARVLSAEVSDDGELFALTVGNGGSHLVKYSLSSEQLQASYDYAGLAIDVLVCEDNLALVTTDSVVWLDRDLQEKAAYTFDGRYLSAFAGGDDFIALLLGEYKVGGSKTLVSVSTGGLELGSVEALDDVLAMDALKEWTAILLSDSVSVYDQKLQLVYSLDAVSGAESIVLTQDGGVVTAGAFSAHAYPNQSR